MDYRLEPYQSLASTQDYLLALLKANKDIHKLVIRATEQTQGKGTHGRQFISTKGGSYQSIAFNDKNNNLQKPYSSLYFAIALAKELAQKNINVQIKWPNDIYYQNKKLAGILAQYSKRHLIVGIGVNVDNYIPVNAIAIDLDLAEVNELVIKACLQAYQYFSSDFDLQSEFKDYDYLFNKKIEFQTKSSVIYGQACGITHQGYLLIKNNKHKTKHYCRTGQVVLKD